MKKSEQLYTLLLQASNTWILVFLGINDKGKEERGGVD